MLKVIIESDNVVRYVCDENTDPNALELILDFSENKSANEKSSLDNALKDVAFWIAHYIPHPTKLKLAVLGDETRIKSQIAKDKVSKCLSHQVFVQIYQNIEEVDLSGVGFHPASVFMQKAGHYKFSNIKKLNLNGISLCTFFILQDLEGFLKNNPNIEELSLSGTRLASGFETICKVLSVNQKIKKLDVSNTNIPKKLILGFIDKHKDTLEEVALTESKTKSELFHDILYECRKNNIVISNYGYEHQAKKRKISEVEPEKTPDQDEGNPITEECKYVSQGDLDICGDGFQSLLTGKQSEEFARELFGEDYSEEHYVL